MMKDWISAFRLRTLPLALSSILMGNFLAAAMGIYNGWICALTILTTIFLQILSNLANDYGDSVHGADSVARLGPTRAVQTGAISAASMKRAMVIFGILSFVSGLFLILMVFPDDWIMVVAFLMLGLMAIYAAITYTAGNNPYGYLGLGDISVFLFFGLVGVLGSFYLQTRLFEWSVLLPATSCGLFATGVLNVNNIRDIDSDKKAGKKSIPVRIGRKSALIYHLLLLTSALFSAVAYTLLNYQQIGQWLFLLSMPLFIKNIMAVGQYQQADQLDPYLKQLALSTLLFVVLFGIGHFF